LWSVERPGDENYGVADVGKAMGDIGRIGGDTVQEQNDYCL